MATVVFAASIATPQNVTSTPVISATEYPVFTTATSSPVITFADVSKNEKKNETLVIKKKVKRIAPISPYKGDCSAYALIIDQYDWATSTAMQICRDESGGNPEAINWNDVHHDRNGNVICVSSRGLFQLGCFWPRDLGYKLNDLAIPEKNIAMAYQVYVKAKNSFTPWTTYRR